MTSPPPMDSRWLWRTLRLRRGRQGAHTRFIDTETFGPFLMVW